MLLLHRGLLHRGQGTAAAVDTESRAPAAMMMQLVRFKDDDPDLYSETDKKLVTNGPTAYIMTENQGAPLHWFGDRHQAAWSSR